MSVIARPDFFQTVRYLLLQQHHGHNGNNTINFIFYRVHFLHYILFNIYKHKRKLNIMQQETRRLPTLFYSNRNTYRQIEEGGNYYLYGVWNLKDNAEGDPSYFEIFRKTCAKSETINGKQYPERETYPKKNNFGSWAWCCNTLSRVEYIKTEKGLN